MVAEVGVHDDNEVALGELKAVHVRRSEAELARSGLELDMRAVGLDELVGDLLGTVGGAVVDDDEFPVEVTGGIPYQLLLACLQFTRPPNSSRTTGSLLLRESSLQQPGDDREVLALVESGQDHRVDVLGRALGHGEVIRMRYWER